ncbi:MAG: hypothetical protein AAF589_05170 [Planctomycetota bacterium]
MPVCRRTLFFLLIACWSVSAAAQSTDPDVRFVEAMRQQGYYDLALEYLDRAATGVVSEELRNRIAYEQSATRLAQANSFTDATQRDQAVAAAQRDFEAFVRKTKNKALAAEGSGRLAAALSQQAARLMAKAERLTAANQKAERSQLLKAASAGYDNARRLYKEADKAYEVALEKYKSAKPRSPQAQRRQVLRTRRAVVQVMGARSLYDKAKTLPKGSKRFKELNTKAAEELVTYADEYHREPIGAYAGLYEGQCYQANGQHKLAMGCFEEIISQDPDEPAFREIITLGYTYLAASRIVEQKVEQAADDGAAWLRELRAGESPAASAALKFQVGIATMMLADAQEDGDARRLYSRAQQLLREAGRVPGEFQADARVKLAELNAKLGAEEQPLTNFADAFQAGKDAITAMAVTNLAGGKKESEASKQAKRDEARAAFHAALALVDDETELKRINEARYWLGYLYWESGDFLRAAAISEFIASGDPKDPSAERSARLALASLERLYNEAATVDSGDASSEAARLQRVAAKVAEQWAGDSLADAAFSMMLKLALRSGDLAAARDVVSRAPEGRRASLELKFANASWEQATRLAIAAQSDPTMRTKAQQAKANARKLLRQSFDKKKPGIKTTTAEATAALYLSKALIDDGKAAQAVKLLEDKRRGPLTLVAKKDASVDRPGYAAEAYKIALRAYVSVTPPRTDAALKTMDRLEEAVGPGGALTRVYFGLGIQLQQQIASLNATGKAGEAKRLSKAFAVFLDRLSKQSGDADWVTRQWIGQTYMTLGDGLKDTGDPGARRKYYEQAAEVFQSMIDRAASDAAFPPSPNSVLAARMQLGQSHRKNGDFAAAIDTFSSLLIERPTMLDVQKAAAYTYQEWGADGEPDQLQTAIRGGRVLPETGKNLVWGWSKLAGIAGRAARSKPEYKDLFFECWLNVATCRTLAGEQASGAERDKQLASALRTIKSVLRQYPELGSPQRWRQFDTLVKRIQRLEGDEAEGLAAFES